MVTIRQTSPELIPRDLTWTLSMQVYEDEVLVTPTVGAWVLRDHSGHVVLEKTPTLGETSTVALLATDLEEQPYDIGYTEEWTFTVDGVELPPIRREACIVRSVLYPTVTSEDLYAALKVLYEQLPSSLASYQDYIDEAWRQILSRLTAQESFPQYVISAWSLRTLHIYWALSLISNDFAQEEAGDGKWTKATDRYEDKVKEEWASLQFRVDRNEDGGSDELKEGAVPVIYTTGPRRYRYRRLR